MFVRKVKDIVGRIGGSILLVVWVLSCDNLETEDVSINAATGHLEINATDAGAIDDAVDSAALNLVLNGGFDSGADSWWLSGIIPDSLTTSNGELCVGVPGGSVTPWSVMVGQGGVPLEEGVGYTFQFTARATEEVVVKALVGEPNGEYREFSTIHPSLRSTPQTFSQTFQMGASDYVPQVAFQIGAGDVDWTFCLDNVSVVPLAKEHIINGTFDEGMNPWWTDGYLADWDVASGAFCANVPSTEEPWQGLLGQNDIKIEAGTSYTISFFASGDPEEIRAVVQDPSDYSAIGMLTATAAEFGERYSATFTAAESVDDAQFMFQLGGADAPWHICIDDVSLVGGSAVPPYEPETGPRVRVNQVGYLPFASKRATLVTDSVEPLAYSLIDGAGQVVARGETDPFGIDPMSLLNVHTIDFSSWTTEGEGYTLVSDGESSYSFAIGTEGYEKLRYDSLSFFYTMRSGTTIDASIAGEGYGRPAGHAVSPQDGAVNQGDADVPCQPAEDSALYYGEPWTCDYTLNVVGGWYDAGDPGKYVVGGGITVFQLLNAFERGKSAPSSDLGALKDGSLRIPETANGIPDILDEVRYELEFFLKMIVPKGKPQEGMVHHKIHGNEWTQLPLLPHEDPTTRWLHRPSTAATLNVAAVAAQAARIFAPYDKAFAKTLLKAARTTWAAALANPAIYAPSADGDDGGGAYADSNVSDEFYWAAAELYLTTGEKTFLDYIESSPIHTADVFTPDGTIWFDTAGLARIDLATVPSALPDRDAVIESVIEGANGYLNDQRTAGFGQPYNPPSGVYPWGSNGQVLNNLMVLGAAYDLSGDDIFRQGALQGIDYILGRNPLNISYVTDFGTVFSHNMHSRWFAHQLDPSLPTPPKGTVSGGPNAQTWTWDPIANRLFGAQGCAPAFCYVDDIESYATNEFAINWNASLAWIASFIADQDTAESAPIGECEVSFQPLTKCSKKGTFSALLTLTNTADATVNDWSLSWSFFGDQTVRNALPAEVDQEGAMVTLTPKNKMKLKPGKSRAFIVTGNLGTMADPTPGTFFLNGDACTMK
jgi:endoglucanase